MISDEEIDLVLLANITTQWRKVARVVATTMSLMDREERGGRNDLYFARRVAVLVEKGLIESTGDVSSMRYCEIRLSPESIGEISSGFGQFPAGWNDPTRPSDSIERKLLRVKRLVYQHSFEEALAECNNLLSRDPEHKDEILRERAHAFAMSGDYESAVRDHELVINGASPEMRDYYLGAFRAIFADEIEKSVGWFEELLRLGVEQKEVWFESATLFYLSYAHMKLDDYDKATQYLDEAIRIEADIAMPIPEGMCTNSQLREEIERRRSS
jgi:tetratricopeptide (TPR) repeat protein